MGASLDSFFPPPEIHLAMGINAGAEEVWRAVRDPALHLRWNLFVRRFAFQEGGGEGEARCRLPLGREVVYRATLGKGEKGDWPRWLLLEQTSHGWFLPHSSLRYAIESVGKTSRIRLDARFVVRPFVLRRISGAFLADLHSRSLARVKEWVETGRIAFLT